jgi:hypothetical protein
MSFEYAVGNVSVMHRIKIEALFEVYVRGLTNFLLRTTFCVMIAISQLLILPILLSLPHMLPEVVGFGFGSYFVVHFDRLSRKGEMPLQGILINLNILLSMQNAASCNRSSEPAAN